MTGPLQPIYDACNAGDSWAKYAKLPSFPRLIDLELTNTCNFRCLMCPTGNLSVRRPKGFMAYATLAKLVDQCAPHGTALRFIGWGEPLLHPQVAAFVAQATTAGLLTHLNTNGSKLTRELAEALIGAGLKAIKFSFQGVDRKTFAEMRNVDWFQGLIETLRMFARVRGASAVPFVQVATTITDERPEIVEQFKALVGPLADQVSIGRTDFDFIDFKAARLRPDELERLKGLASRQSIAKVHPECPEVFDKLSIHWDGAVAACCHDSDNLMTLGNINEQPLSEIWLSPRLDHYRTMLAAMRHDELPLCSTCYDAMGLVAGATELAA